ncbi:MAG: DUF6588 family protein [candidate division Zixibacteria bacterium]|nr:DUF6588 family protein [candidate division Zixibacteria bacterium]
MKTNHRIYIVLILLFAMAVSLYGQIINFTEAIQAGISDGEKLIKAYVTPFERSLNTIGGTAYLNFSDTTKESSFYIRINYLSVTTPQNERSFDVDELGLEYIKASDPNNSIAQNFAGNDSTMYLETTNTYRIPTFTFPFYNELPIYKFTSPAGVNPILSLPFLTVGAHVQETYINIRFLPKLKIPGIDGSISSYGANFQQNMGQFIKPLGRLPFDLDFMIGFQYTIISISPNLVPDESKIGIYLQNDNGPYDDQEFNIKSYSIPLELAISKQIKNATIFGGVVLNIANSKVELLGNYPIYTSDPTNTFQVIVQDISDPFSYTQSYNKLFFNLGLMYRIGPVKLIGEYSFADYNSYNIGIETGF